MAEHVERLLDDVRQRDITLDQLALWFAREIACNEMRWPHTAFPLAFRHRVAIALVDDEFCGWPDYDEATTYLDELYTWG
jgi:hypothetical protein